MHWDQLVHFQAPNVTCWWFGVQQKCSRAIGSLSSPLRTSTETRGLHVTSGKKPKWPRSGGYFRKLSRSWKSKWGQNDGCRTFTRALYNKETKEKSRGGDLPAAATGICRSISTRLNFHRHLD